MGEHTQLIAERNPLFAQECPPPALRGPHFARSSLPDNRQAAHIERTACACQKILHNCRGNSARNAEIDRAPPHARHSLVGALS
eukprot:4465867-Lingulodinium_polyedra.AAC.2